MPPVTLSQAHATVAHQDPHDPCPPMAEGDLGWDHRVPVAPVTPRDAAGVWRGPRAEPEPPPPPLFLPPPARRMEPPHRAPPPHGAELASCSPPPQAGSGERASGRRDAGAVSPPCPRNSEKGGGRTGPPIPPPPPPKLPTPPWGCPTAAEQDGGALPAPGGSLRRGDRTRYVDVPSCPSPCVGVMALPVLAPGTCRLPAGVGAHGCYRQRFGAERGCSAGSAAKLSSSPSPGPRHGRSHLCPSSMPGGTEGRGRWSLLGDW